jgi:hypothetical protein
MITELFMRRSYSGCLTGNVAAVADVEQLLSVARNLPWDGPPTTPVYQRCATFFESDAVCHACTVLVFKKANIGPCLAFIVPPQPLLAQWFGDI